MILVVVGTSTGAAVGTYLRQQRQSAQLTLPVANSNQPPAAWQPTSTKSIQTTSTNFITAAVEKVGPAVVRVDAERTVNQNPLVQKFLGDLPKDEQVEKKGTGSGFILSSDGRIEIGRAHV